jgi:hypothetical protein
MKLSKLSDRWEFFQANGYEPWLRTTRTTVGESDVILRHPYPIGIKSNKVKVHEGSLYQKISQDNMSSGFIE